MGVGGGEQGRTVMIVKSAQSAVHAPVLIASIVRRKMSLSVLHVVVRVSSRSGLHTEETYLRKPNDAPRRFQRR